MKKPYEQQWKWDAMSEMVVDEHGRVVSTPANLYDEEVQAIGWVTAAAPDMARALLAAKAHLEEVDAQDLLAYRIVCDALRRARVLP